MMVWRAPLGVDISLSGVSVAGGKTACCALSDESAVGERHAQALRQMTRRQFGRNRACRLSIPATSVREHAMTLPTMSGGELNKVMAQDAFWREAMQLTTDRFMKHWSATRVSDGYRVAMFAVALSEVDVYMTCARQSGLNPRALVVVLPHHMLPNRSALIWLDSTDPRLWLKADEQASTHSLPRPLKQMTAADFEELAGRVAEDATVRIVCADKRADEVTALSQYMRQRLRQPPRVLTPFEYFELRDEGAEGDAFAMARATIARDARLSFRRSPSRAPTKCVTFALAADSAAPRRVCITAAAMLPLMVGWFHWTLFAHAESVAEVEQVNRWMHATRQELTGSIAGMRKQALRRAEERKRLQALNERRDVGTRVVNALGSLLPPSVHLNYFELNTEARQGERFVEIKGLAGDVHSALLLVERLRAMPELGEVKLIEVRSERGARAVKKFHFSIECAARFTE